AALLAARRGARVTGVDPSQRLLELAAGLAAAGLEIAFLPGEGAAMPLEDGAADVLISVFGVIFAPDAAAAASEIARVVAPAGRVVLSAWIPAGAIADAARLGREAVNEALGVPAGPPPFPWHQREALADLFAPYGFALELEERELAFTSGSPRQFIEEESRNHPLRVAGAAALGPERAAAVDQRTLEVFEAANEDPAAFKVTSRYVVAVARSRASATSGAGPVPGSR
ncbi:MAG TPA: methyltransferase domain-containing protein, partial [Solirubrobacterales bacterium]|nr:methyltransferase domain-containing protein [Solirubrobacterales bacterium]